MGSDRNPVKTGYGTGCYGFWGSDHRKGRGEVTLGRTSQDRHCQAPQTRPALHLASFPPLGFLHAAGSKATSRSRLQLPACLQRGLPIPASLSFAPFGLHSPGQGSA